MERLTFMCFNEDQILPHYSIFKVYKNGDYYFIIDPNVNFWFKLSKEQFLTFRLLDGKATTDELLNKIDTYIPSFFREAGIRFIRDIVSNYPIECIDIPKSSKLSALYLVLTTECNSKCLYCFRDLNNSHIALDKDLMLKNILSFRNISTSNPTIVYTGGEPCLYPDLIEIAKFAKKHNISNSLQTNGLLIDENNAPIYAENFDMIQISLDSTNKEVNDCLRGKKGHFEAVNHAISLLRKYDTKIKLAATITKNNFDDIVKIKKTYPDISFQFTPMLKIGKGRKVPYLAFSPDEFLERLTSLYDKEMILNKDIPGFGKKVSLCGSGTSILSISPEGDVFPCQMLHHANLCCGNIKNNLLEDIYLSSTIIKRFRALTVDMIDNCKDCAIRYICAGGCRANAFWLNDDLLAKDYFCEFNEQVTFYNLLRGFKEINLPSFQENR